MSGAMHLQLLSGCPGTIYWLGHYLWDMAAHTAVCCASLLIFWVRALLDSIHPDAACAAHHRSARQPSFRPSSHAKILRVTMLRSPHGRSDAVCRMSQAATHGCMQLPAAPAASRAESAFSLFLQHQVPRSKDQAWPVA